MMPAPLLFALALALSVPAACAGWIGGRLAEWLSADPALRAHAWGAAMLGAALPPLLVGLLLLAPARTLPFPIPAIVLAPAHSAPSATLPASDATRRGSPAVSRPSPVHASRDAAWLVVAAAGCLALLRLATLAGRTRRLARITRAAGAAPSATAAAVDEVAARLGVRAPAVAVSDDVAGALLAGFIRPKLVLARDVADGAHLSAARAIITHELAHLRRGDHRARWVEEAVMALLAINPVLPRLQARRAAAREEACDAIALAGAAPTTRHAYAESLLDALRRSAGAAGHGGFPALTFTGAGKAIAMHRLNAVITPAAPAPRGVRLVALAVALATVAAAGTASAAVAAQRQPMPAARGTLAGVAPSARHTSAAPRIASPAARTGATGRERSAPPGVSPAAPPSPPPLAGGDPRATRQSVGAGDTVPLTFVLKASVPITAADGDVVKVWLGGALAAGNGQPQGIEMTLTPGPFDVFRTIVNLPASSGGAKTHVAYRAAIVDRSGRVRYEGWMPDVVVVGDTPMEVTVLLLPTDTDEAVRNFLANHPDR